MSRFRQCPGGILIRLGMMSELYPELNHQQ